MFSKCLLKAAMTSAYARPVWGYKQVLLNALRLLLPILSAYARVAFLQKLFQTLLQQTAALIVPALSGSTLFVQLSCRRYNSLQQAVMPALVCIFPRCASPFLLGEANTV
jgi:hypothetical protein